MQHVITLIEALDDTTTRSTTHIYHDGNPDTALCGTDLRDVPDLTGSPIGSDEVICIVCGDMGYPEVGGE